MGDILYRKNLQLSLQLETPTIWKFQEDSIFELRDFLFEVDDGRIARRKDSFQNLTKRWDFEKKCLNMFMACNQTLNPLNPTMSDPGLYPGSVPAHRGKFETQPNLG